MKKSSCIKTLAKMCTMLAICFIGQPYLPAQDTAMVRGRSASYRIHKAETNISKARVYESDNKMADALRFYLSALYELETIPDSGRISMVKTSIGDIYFKNDMAQKAMMFYGEALAISPVKTVNPRSLSLQLKIAGAELKLNRFNQAAILATNIYTEAKKISNPFIQLQALLLLFEAQVAANDWLSAKPTAYNVTAWYQNLGDTSNLINSLSNLAYIQQKLGESDSAIQTYDEVARLEIKTQGYINPATIVNQAIVYQNEGNTAKSLALLNLAARSATSEKDPFKLAEFTHLTALVYFTMRDFYNAGIYNAKCIEFAKKSKHSQVLKEALLLSSEIKKVLYDYEGALVDYQQYLSLRDSLALENRLQQQELTQLEFSVERIAFETQNLWADEELNWLELQRLKLDSANRQKQIEILYQSDSIQKITIQNQRLENTRAMQALLLKEEQIYSARKKKEADSLQQVGKIQSLQLEQQQLVQKQQQNRIDLLDRENQIKALNLRKVKARNQFLFGFGVLALVIIYMVYRGLRYQKKTNRILVKQNNEIERQKDEIEFQRQQSEKLLLNILPEETAEELKEKGSATPRQYQLVSVLFTDFKGFTNIAEKLTPEALVAELDNCFLAFDRIIDKYNLEKIKTIGDAYMCAGGIPVANTSNPIDTVMAGLEIRNYMEQLKNERELRGEKYWELRIGIHTGQVVAGVVGKNKFAYDIWGDAVNTASRMESSGVPGQVNISGTTFALVKHAFKCTHRGKIAAKNKGEIDMYIVEKAL